MEAKIFETISQSTFNSDIGLKLLIRRLLSLAFLSNYFITACLLLPFVWFKEFMNGFFSSSKNIFIFIKLLCQTIASWRFVIFKLFIPTITSCLLISSSQTFFFSWLKVSREIPLRFSLYTCFGFLSFL